MGIKKIILIFMCIFPFMYIATCSASTTLEEKAFKKFTFSICLGTAFNMEGVKDDANKSSNAYRIRGNMSGKALDEARHLANEWLKKSYLSKSGGQIQIMKCIDLYESKELLNLYKKHTPCNSKTNWYDTEDYKKQCKK